MKKNLSTKILLLVIGTITFCFVGLRWNIPIIIWIWPISFLLFLRNEKSSLNSLIPIPLLIISSYMSIQGGMEMSFWLHLGISIVRPLPFLAALYTDKLLLRKINPIMHLFIYPGTYVIIDYIFTLIPFLGSSFSLATGLFDNKSIIQLSSFTGIWGISFIVSLFSTMLLFVWGNWEKIKIVYIPVIIYSSFLFLVLFFGGLRYSVHVPKERTVKVGSITIERNGITEGEIKKRLFESSQDAVDLGAKIVFWSEWNLIVKANEVDNFKASAKDFANANRIYFSPSIVIDFPNIHSENIVYLFNPEGELLFEYYKTKSWLPTSSDGIIKAAETPYGTLSIVICFDLDFPTFINKQLRKKNVDILLVPANDWKPIAPFHSQVGMIRGIENGFSIVRQTYEGLSFASDFHGRVLNYQNYFNTEVKVMLTDVPIKGVKTIYSTFGDWFIYIIIFFMLSSLIVTIIKRNKEKV